ncbi:MAG TPA: thioredoxin domain-containing protein, partial [Sandaracinaceae bacterium LLY-WYZ-13_1]|nr:thioredoxin domain-containing protein [Sandaracinaceae bacterium LLY-WYZ-13_1]
ARRAAARNEPPPAAELPEDGVERLRVSTDGAPRRGAERPLVTVVTFSDFQCPFCGRAQATLERLLREYPDDVQLVFRHNPLAFHQQAGPAARAAIEVYEQGGDAMFWRFHDLLFENQRALTTEDLARYAAQVGADPTAVRRAIEDGAHDETIDADQAAAARLDARGTPAFFLNGRKLMGAQPYERFRELVDEELGHARAALRSGVPRTDYYARLMEDALDRPPADAPARRPRRARRRPDPDAVYRVPVDGRPQRGPDDALVTIVMFTEFQCPFCSRVQPTLDQIVQRYGTDVRIVHRHNPLPFHDNAMPAAHAASEVHRQLGDHAFFAYAELLYQNQRSLDRATLVRLAGQVGANTRQVERALDTDRFGDEIQADRQLARSLGASGTPSFFINGVNVRGAQPFPAFERVIDAQLARAQEAVRQGTSRDDLYEALIEDGATSPRFVGGDQEGGGAEAEAPSRPAEAPVYEIEVPRRAPTRGGGRSAPVTVQIFSDFQCPFCNRVRPTLDRIVDHYGDRVRLVFRNYPLPFHQNAMPAAEAAREVFLQRGNRAFWEFHDLLFDHQRALTEDRIVELADRVRGVNARRVRRALNDHRHRDDIQRDMQAVQDAGARIGTPSFFVNGRLVQGAQPFPVFQTAIDAALSPDEEDGERDAGED